MKKLLLVAAVMAASGLLAGLLGIGGKHLKDTLIILLQLRMLTSVVLCLV